jgi:hypothetical protein
MCAAPLPLSERIRVAGFNLMVAHVSHDIWWLYIGADTRPHYVEAMERYYNFFRYDQEAHFRALIVGVYTLFDKRRDTITLASLAEDARGAGFDVSAIEAKLNQLSGRVRKIEIMRHKLFAHRDHSMAYNDVFKAAQLRPDDLKDVLRESLVIVNDLAALVGAKVTSLNTEVSGDTKAMLEHLMS